MKKILLVLIAMMLSLSVFSGCDEGTINDVSEVSSRKETGTKSAITGSDNTITESNCIIRENDEYSLVLPISKSVLKVRKEYVPYLDDVDFELLKASEEKLSEKISQYSNNSGCYLSKDQEGYLCLCVEAIVSIPSSEFIRDDDEWIQSGCGIDHEHLFFVERITK